MCRYGSAGHHPWAGQQAGPHRVGQKSRSAARRPGRPSRSPPVPPAAQAGSVPSWASHRLAEACPGRGIRQAAGGPQSRCASLSAPPIVSRHRSRHHIFTARAATTAHGPAELRIGVRSSFIAILLGLSAQLDQSRQARPRAASRPASGCGRCSPGVPASAQASSVSLFPRFRSTRTPQRADDHHCGCRNDEPLRLIGGLVSQQPEQQSQDKIQLKEDAAAGNRRGGRPTFTQPRAPAAATVSVRRPASRVPEQTHRAPHAWTKTAPRRTRAGVGPRRGPIAPTPVRGSSTDQEQGGRPRRG